MAHLAPLTLPLGGKTPPPDWRKKDAVYTEAHLARFLVRLLPWDGIRTVLEPSVGGGAWVLALAEEVDQELEVVGVDIAPDCPGAYLERDGYRFELGDIREADPGDGVLFDRAIGNPIYSAIPEQVNRTLELADEVAFLLPMHIVSGGEELPRWLLDSPLRAYWPLVQRPWPKKLRGCGFFWWARDLPPLRERMDTPVGFPARDWR